MAFIVHSVALLAVNVQVLNFDSLYRSICTDVHAI